MSSYELTKALWNTKHVNYIDIVDLKPTLSGDIIGLQGSGRIVGPDGKPTNIDTSQTIVVPNNSTTGVYRYDLIIINSTGTLSLIAGTEVATDDMASSVNSVPQQSLLIGVVKISDAGKSLLDWRTPYNLMPAISASSPVLRKFTDINTEFGLGTYDSSTNTLTIYFSSTGHTIANGGTGTQANPLLYYYDLAKFMDDNNVKIADCHLIITNELAGGTISVLAYNGTEGGATTFYLKNIKRDKNENYTIKLTKLNVRGRDDNYIVEDSIFYFDNVEPQIIFDDYTETDVNAPNLSCIKANKCHIKFQTSFNILTGNTATAYNNAMIFKNSIVHHNIRAGYRNIYDNCKIYIDGGNWADDWHYNAHSVINHSFIKINSSAVKDQLHKITYTINDTGSGVDYAFVLDRTSAIDYNYRAVDQKLEGYQALKLKYGLGSSGASWVSDLYIYVTAAAQYPEDGYDGSDATKAVNISYVLSLIRKYIQYIYRYRLILDLGGNTITDVDMSLNNIARRAIYPYGSEIIIQNGTFVHGAYPWKFSDMGRIHFKNITFSLYGQVTKEFIAVFNSSLYFENCNLNSYNDNSANYWYYFVRAYNSKILVQNLNVSSITPVKQILVLTEGSMYLPVDDTGVWHAQSYGINASYGSTIFLNSPVIGSGGIADYYIGNNTKIFYFSDKAYDKARNLSDGTRTASAAEVIDAIADDVGSISDSVVVGDALVVQSDGTFKKAIATNDDSVDAIALETVDGSTSPVNGKIMFKRKLVTPNTTFASADIGKKVYLSDTTAGAYTTTAPTTSGTNVVIVGKIIATDKLLFDPRFVVTNA